MSILTFTAPVIQDFAAAVRAALDDLPKDEIEELTGGLEADLIERAKDANAEKDFGDPLAYAEELRGAAGLPVGRKRRLTHSNLSAKLRTWRVDAERAIRSTAMGSGSLDFAIAIRPLWWLLRGWAIYSVAFSLFSPGLRSFGLESPWDWMIFTPFLVVSVQWGRGRWLSRAWLKVSRTLLSAIAIAVFPLLVILIWGGSATSYAVTNESYSAPGLSMNGTQIGNIFAYDEDGQPLTGVQLFDQAGEPIVTTDDLQAPWTWESSDSNGMDTVLVPSSLATGANSWNIFPLDQASLSAEGDYSSAASPATPPFPRVRPLASRSTPAPTPTPSVTILP